MWKNCFFGCCGNSRNSKKWGNLDSLGVVKTFGIPKNGETWIVWVLQNFRNSKKWRKMNSLGVVGTLGIQKNGEK